MAETNKQLLDLIDSILVQKTGNTTPLTRYSKILLVSHLIPNPLTDGFIDNELIIDELIYGLCVVSGVPVNLYNLNYDSVKLALGLKGRPDWNIYEEVKSVILLLQFMLKSRLQSIVNGLAVKEDNESSLNDVTKLLDNVFKQEFNNTSNEIRWSKILVTSHLVPSILSKSKYIEDDNYINIFTSVISAMIWNKMKEKDFEKVYNSVTSFDDAIQLLGLESKCKEDLYNDARDFIYVYELILKGIIADFISKI